MSDQLRDKIARALHQHATDDGEVHILWGGVEEHDAEVAEWIPYADAVLAVLDAETEWEYRCKLRSTNPDVEHEWVAVDAGHLDCSGVQERRRKAGPWEPVPEGAER